MAWRICLVLVSYALGALLVLALLRVLARVLFLPPLFLKLGQGALILGVPLAVFLAWRYPDLGGGSGDGPS